MSFVSDFLPTLDQIRATVPTEIGVRSATLTVRALTTDGAFHEGGNTVGEDVVIGSAAGHRYKVRELSAKEVVAGGSIFQNGSLKVGPITPPHAGGGFTKAELLPPSSEGQEVYYGVTDASGQTQWCELASSDTLSDLHWFLVLNPTGAIPEAP